MNELRLIEKQEKEYQPVQQVGMIMPAATIDQAVEQFQLYQQLKKRIGTPEDFQIIGGKQHPKKSFVRKVQRFFNVSCEIVQDEPLRDEKGKIIAWLAKARAIHLATGAYQEADGSCGFDEKKQPNQRTIHNIRAHAITRAKNRAILDLVGFGEVSAEEIESGEYETYRSRPAMVNDTETLATEKQVKAIYSVAREKGVSEERLKSLYTKVGKSSVKELSRQEASELIAYLQGGGN